MHQHHLSPLEDGSVNAEFADSSAESQIEEDQSLSPVLKVINNFSTIWFTICMDTGVLGLFLHNFPFPSQWTHTCSIVIFVFELVLFLLFGAISLLRWLIFFRPTLRCLKNDAEEIALQACPAITWLTLAAQIQLICAARWGFGFAMLAYVMWWIGLVWVLLISVILYLHLIRKPHRAFVDKWLPTAIFIPLVGALTVGDVAGVMINGGSGPSQFGRALAIPTIIVGFICVGFALGLSCVMYAIYMHRLMVSGWPSALKIPSMILTIGPCGQSASALLQLSAAAIPQSSPASQSEGFFLTQEATETVHVICVLMALLFLGFAVFWMLIDYFAIVEGLLTRKIHPSLFWWSTIFPVSTVVTTLALLGQATNSPALKIISIALFILLCCIYLVNLYVTIHLVLSGELLGLPKHPSWALGSLKQEHSWA